MDVLAWALSKLETDRDVNLSQTHVNFQVDNSGSNKNNTLFTFAALAVQKGIVKSISVNFLRVGHTDEDMLTKLRPSQCLDNKTLQHINLLQSGRTSTNGSLRWRTSAASTSQTPAAWTTLCVASTASKANRTGSTNKSITRFASTRSETGSNISPCSPNASPALPGPALRMSSNSFGDQVRERVFLRECVAPGCFCECCYCCNLCQRVCRPACSAPSA